MPVNINARQVHFDIRPLMDASNVTWLSQNFTRQDQPIRLVTSARLLYKASSAARPAALSKPFSTASQRLSDIVARINGTTVTGEDLSYGYLTWADQGANQFTFLAPLYFDPVIGAFTEKTKPPINLGEILTIGSQPKAAMGFTDPVLVVTGNEHAIFCGGNCTTTGGVTASIPAEVKMVSPNST